MTGQIAELSKEDCFWRVSELEGVLAGRFRKYYQCRQNIDRDEQGIPAKCYHSAIQYNGDKPYKYFFKLYCLNGSFSSYMHNFYLFRGKDSDKRAGIPASALPIIKLTDHPIYIRRTISFMWTIISIQFSFVSIFWRKDRFIQLELSAPTEFLNNLFRTIGSSKRVRKLIEVP
jgi:hypothetical protein